MTGFTQWVDDRIRKAIDSTVVEAIASEFTSYISNLEHVLETALEQQSEIIIKELTTQVVDGVEQIITNAAGNVDKVVGDIGGTITNTMDHFTVDTAALAQAVAQAIKGLLPPIFGRRKA